MGVLLVAASERLRRQGFIVLLALIGHGVSIAAFALSRWLLLSCLLIFLSGTAMMASASLMLSLVQAIVADQMRGRVMSVYNLTFRLGIPLGGLALGKLIPVLGVSTALAGSGLALIGVAVYVAIALREVAIFQRSVREPA